MSRAMLTTVDNPYNPFIQFDEWFAFDQQQGYHTCEYLARIAHTSNDLSDEMNDAIVESAINEIIDFNLIGIYQKVTPENFNEIKSKGLTEDQEEALKLLNEA